MEGINFREALTWKSVHYGPVYNYNVMNRNSLDCELRWFSVLEIISKVYWFAGYSFSTYVKDLWIWNEIIMTI